MKKFTLLVLIAFLLSIEISAMTKQGYYRWRNDDGSLITATAKADTNTPAQTVVGENIRLRVELWAIGNIIPNDIILSWSTDGSAWTQITDAATGHFQLSSTTYYDEQNTINDYLPNFMSMPHSGGYTIETTSSKPMFTINGAESYEAEYCFKATPNALLNTDYFFNVRYSTGSSFEFIAMHMIPTLQVIDSQPVPLSDWPIFIFAGVSTLLLLIFTFRRIS